MNTSTFATIYAAALHLSALVALTVLVAMGKISWAEGGPIIAGLVGVGVAVPLTIAATTTTAADKPPEPPAAV